MGSNRLGAFQLPEFVFIRFKQQIKLEEKRKHTGVWSILALAGNGINGLLTGIGTRVFTISAPET